jgi:hypothetical protein
MHTVTSEVNGEKVDDSNDNKTLQVLNTSQHHNQPIKTPTTDNNITTHITNNDTITRDTLASRLNFVVDPTDGALGKFDRFKRQKLNTLGAYVAHTSTAYKTTINTTNNKKRKQTNSSSNNTSNHIDNDKNPTKSTQKPTTLNEDKICESLFHTLKNSQTSGRDSMVSGDETRFYLSPALTNAEEWNIGGLVKFLVDDQDRVHRLELCIAFADNNK